MFKLGLTGSIATGKSTALAAFAALGVPTFSSDDAVHALYAGEAARAVETLEELVEAVLELLGAAALLAHRGEQFADESLQERRVVRQVVEVRLGDRGSVRHDSSTRAGVRELRYSDPVFGILPRPIRAARNASAAWR